MSALATEIDRPDGHAALLRARIRNCEAFLATRGTSLARIGEFVGARMDGVRAIYLTSSPVHGLANATSDIDTICVVDGETMPERTATQIFDDDNHYETIPFTTIEVAAEMARLEAAARLSPGKRVSAYKTWDKNGPIARKYLERLVNGVPVREGGIYLDHLGALAVLWKTASLARAVTMTACAELSLAAGERRGALGYGLNAALYAMDAFLSHHGDVYSNKKWFLLRFHRFLAGEAGRESPISELGSTFSALWERLEAAFRSPGGEVALLRHLSEAVLRLDAVVGLDLSERARWDCRAPTSMEFLPGAMLHLAGDHLLADVASAPVAGTAQKGEAYLSFAVPPDLARTDALSRLRMIRAGLFTADFSGDRISGEDA